MFEFYKGAVILKKSHIEVPELATLIKDKGTELELALCQYIFLICDRSEENPLRDLQDYQRDKLARTIAFKDDTNKIDEDLWKEIRATKRAYTKAKVAKIQKDIDLYDKKMFQFILLLDETDPKITKNEHDMSGVISYTSNIEIITKILDGIMDVIIDKSIIVGMKNSGKFIQNLRGGLSPNMKGKTLQIKD